MMSFSMRTQNRIQVKIIQSSVAIMSGVNHLTKREINQKLTSLMSFIPDTRKRNDTVISPVSRNLTMGSGYKTPLIFSFAQITVKQRKRINIPNT